MTEHAPYPVSVKIECPACGGTCAATKHFHDGDPFPALGHTCEHCGYQITESEWHEVNDGERAMTKRTYPRVMAPERCLGLNRPGRSQCSVCGKAIADRDPMVVVETQQSWFRGDDDVEFYHEVCYGREYPEVVK
jgi:hypothetical protein